MAPQPSGGTTSAAAAKPPQPSTNGTYNFHRSGDELRCRCCPYGFHIDLDFVKFAENVTAGNDQAHKWNTQPRRTTRRRGNYSVDESATTLPRQIITRDTNSFDTPDEWLKAAGSPIDSNMSQSTIGGFYSGADDDILPTQDSYTNYLAKNKSDSIVARLIGELNGINNAQKPPIPPPISSSTPYPGQDFIDHKPQKSWHGATSANSEIHEILSRQQPTYSTTREFSKTVTSAPSSPTPVKTYHSAVAQSAGRKAQTHTHSATTSKHQQQHNHQHPITPPRRYFDSARPRVLSPEPAVRDRSLAPTALRTSNFHSRTYYSPTSTTERPHVPYRGATTSSLSTGLDFNSFASVRRQRTTSTDNERNRTLSPIYNRQTGGSRLDGYTSDAEYRTTYRYEMSPPPLPPRSHAPLTPTPTTPVKMYSYGNSTILKKPENTFENLKKPETVERGVDAYDVVQKAPTAVLQHQESQTHTPPEQKHASTVTDTEEEEEQQQLKTELSTQKTQTSKIDQSTIGCNTDNIPEEPFQPEKAFSVEFQFAIGHGDKLSEEDQNSEKIPTIPKETKDQGSDAIKTAMFSFGMNTDKIGMVDKACMPMPPPVKPKTAEKGVVTDAVQESETEKKESSTIETQTEQTEEVLVVKLESKVEATKSESTTIQTQTDNDWIEIEIERRIKAEKAERKSVDKITETEEEDSGEFIMITCTKCEQSSISNGHEHYEKIVENEVEAGAEEGEEGEEEVDPNHTQTDSIGDHESGFSNSSTDLEEFEKLEQSIQEQEKHNDHDSPPEPMFRHSLSSEPEYSDHDRESLDTVSIKTMIMVDSTNANSEEKKPVDSSKIEAIRKLLTEPSRSPFSRESGAYRSYRTEKAKTTDDLDFITDKHNLNDDTGEPSTPSTTSQSPLTDVVMLKKAIQITSLVPEPVAAKIPRPKVSKYNLTSEEASTPDEEEEAADRLTPLRSELRSLAAWSHGGGPFGPAQDIGYRRFAAAQNAAVSRTTPMEDDEVEGEIQNSGASSDSEGTYEMSDKEDPDEIIEFEMSEPLKEALETLNDHLKKPDDVATQAVDWAQRYVQHTWLKMSTKRKSTAGWVEKFLDALESYEPALMELIVNFADNNGNTALHYAVSHENYDLVSVLLDSKVCNVDNNNIAGYSPVMLGSLCEIHNETQSTIIQRLFEIGNVNAKAIKHGQTALQLAASHGRVESTQLLLNCGADVNIQDIDGSTALMCAAEHGHKEIAKMLLKCSNIDASLTDCDNQTALSIAVQQGHKALAVLIYAHLNFHRYQSSENSSAV